MEHLELISQFFSRLQCRLKSHIQIPCKSLFHRRSLRPTIFLVFCSRRARQKRHGFIFCVAITIPSNRRQKGFSVTQDAIRFHDHLACVSMLSGKSCSHFGRVSNRKAGKKLDKLVVLVREGKVLYLKTFFSVYHILCQCCRNICIARIITGIVRQA